MTTLHSAELVVIEFGIATLRDLLWLAAIIGMIRLLVSMSRPIVFATIDELKRIVRLLTSR
jgi:hypothetical protein